MPGRRCRHSALDVVGPGYFSALGVPIPLGREILESDRGGAPKVCVINEAFAKRFFDEYRNCGSRLAAVGIHHDVGKINSLSPGR